MPSRALLLRHPLSVAGVVLSTTSAVIFIALVVAMAFGDYFNNPYAALIVLLGVPAFFVLGLVLIPIGMWLEYRWVRHHPGAAREWFVFDFRQRTTRTRALLVLTATAVSLAIVLLAGSTTVHWMESPSFCGAVCHTPMHPQFTAWQSAPHSQIACVQCHVGEGHRAFLKYKLKGVEQLYLVATNGYERPIPSVADMRPARDVCATCHWSNKGFGDVVRVKREYGDDETNTESTTILQLFVGGPDRPSTAGRAIHWHADPRVQIEFVATDADRQSIPYVRVTEEGRVREYTVEGTTPETLAKGERRVMDCIDCHNAVAHRLAPTAEDAVDDAIEAGRIDRALPSVRREAVRLMKTNHASADEAVRVIDRELRKLYSSSGAGGNVDAAVTALQNVYQRNVFPAMKVTFGTYPNNIGHVASAGCFRCHDGSHVAKDGSAISGDCEYCHKQIEPRPEFALRASQ